MGRIVVMTDGCLPATSTRDIIMLRQMPPRVSRGYDDKDLKLYVNFQALATVAGGTRSQDRATCLSGKSSILVAFDTPRRHDKLGL